MKDLEKELEELNQKYRELLIEGKTDEATEVVQKARRIKRKNKKEKPEEKDKSNEEENKNSNPKKIGDSKDFERVKGAGPELAIELSEQFESVEKLAEADTEDLIPVPGIGEKTAKSIIKEANKLVEG